MYPLDYPEPPTEAAIAHARAQLASYDHDARSLERHIQHARDALARIVEERQCAIREMERELAALEDKVAHTKAYVSPFKRLPHELLRHIFLNVFEDSATSAWTLSSVCMLWRRLALSMPKLWSKIRLITSHASSAETIRLWLERSGRTVPLDIEIILRSHPTADGLSRRRYLSLPPPHAAGDPWVAGGGWTTPPPVLHNPPAPAAGGTAVHLQIGGAHQSVHMVPVQAVVPADTVGPAPSSPPPHPSEWDMPPLLANPERTIPSQQRLRKNMHWGHIAFYYLVEQMHRWERFVFRFEKQFLSIAALKAIEGDAPLLREFEVSCNDHAFYGDWKWLPSAPVNAHFDLSSLKTLTLQHVPFKWSSPMLRNLRNLQLRSLPTVHIALDRILHIVAANPQLESLSLNFASPNPPVLPLTPCTLPELKTLNLGGHYLLSSLVDSLMLPSLDALILDIEARDPIEDTVSSLLTRSGNPPLTRLSLSYGSNTGPHAGFYWGSGAGVASWHFLAELDHLAALQVGSAPLEPLISALSTPDDDNGQDRWMCPNLTTLLMRGCHAHGDGVAKLVQMVEARNPDTATAGGAGGGGAVINGVAPVRLRHLELYDCTALGPDVTKWLKTRIDEVVCTEPTFEGYVGRLVLVH
ncbi:hypothetical protein L226DRAFT_452719 [Lentinus tigrinus ALCF2SS1-7]|uniref:uncharacterized protein n=1 Tax=Lentinus tigrinus ALCF2SS1-7 TaxID=1328758 RepID=UPI0011660A99|nr:hypothetical protein L226DRAFT_452719 [Lentinus tigrinus ALCF2SS1-7]